MLLKDVLCNWTAGIVAMVEGVRKRISSTQCLECTWRTCFDCLRSFSSSLRTSNAFERQQVLKQLNNVRLVFSG